jgi:uncharacterized MAPEG superfamily protein
MSTSLTALLGFTGWTIALVFVVLLYRTGVVFARRHTANSWPRGQQPPKDEPGIVTRIGHAHLNCLEGLPIFAAIVLVAGAAGKYPVTDPVAMWVLYARMAQSVTHMIGVTHWLVFIRANFFTIQLLLYAYMIWGLLR